MTKVDGKLNINGIFVFMSPCLKLFGNLNHKISTKHLDLSKC